MAKGSIIVVRHGNTDLNTAKVFQPYATPLSATGTAQAQQCGQWLSSSGHRIVAVLTSDLLRTRQTVDQILGSVGEHTPVVACELLRERDFGDLKGQPYGSAPNVFFESDLKEFDPPGGETWLAFEQRVQVAWDWVRHQTESCILRDGDCVLVVTHGLVKKKMASLWEGGAELAKQTSFDNTSVSVVSHSPPHQVALFGSMQHTTAKL